MKKLMTVCLIAVLALGLMGFGFAKWSDTVAINTTVNTGDVSIGIKDAGTTDPGSTLDPNFAPAGVTLNVEPKHVATAESTNGTEIGTTGYYESITETITNAYPYYGPSTTMEIKGLGSVPVKIEDLAIVWTGALADNVQCATWTVTYPNNTTKTGNTFAGLEDAILGVQIHKNDIMTVVLQVYFDQQSEMLESATGTFTVTASQWNEVTVVDPSK